MSPQEQVARLDRMVGQMEQTYGPGGVHGLSGFHSNVRERLLNPKKETFGKAFAEEFNDAFLNTVFGGGDLPLPGRQKGTFNFTTDPDAQRRAQALADSEFERRVESGWFARQGSLTGGVTGGVAAMLGKAAPVAAAGSLAGPKGAVAGFAVGSIASDAPETLSRETLNNYWSELASNPDYDEARDADSFRRSHNAGMAAAGLLSAANVVPVGKGLSAAGRRIGGVTAAKAGRQAAISPVRAKIAKVLTAGDSKTGFTRAGIDIAKGSLDDLAFEGANIGIIETLNSLENTELTKGTTGQRLGLATVTGATVRTGFTGLGKLGQAVQLKRQGKDVTYQNLFAPETELGILGQIDREIIDANAGLRDLTGEVLEERQADIVNLKAAREALMNVWNTITDGTEPIPLDVRADLAAADADPNVRAAYDRVNNSITAFLGIFGWNGKKGMARDLLHEAVHAHFETLPPNVKNSLRALWKAEMDNGAGPLFTADGVVRPDVTPDIMASDRVGGELRGFLEWYAVRMALKNGEWANNKLGIATDGASSMFNMLSTDFRQKAEKVGRTLGLVDGLDASLRNFLDAGDGFTYDRNQVRKNVQAERKAASEDPTNLIPPNRQLAAPLELTPLPPQEPINPVTGRPVTSTEVNSALLADAANALLGELDRRKFTTLQDRQGELEGAIRSVDNQLSEERQDFLGALPRAAEKIRAQQEVDAERQRLRTAARREGQALADRATQRQQQGTPGQRPVQTSPADPQQLADALRRVDPPERPLEQQLASLESDIANVSKALDNPDLASGARYTLKNLNTERDELLSRMGRTPEVEAPAPVTTAVTPEVTPPSFKYGTKDSSPDVRPGDRVRIKEQVAPGRTKQVAARVMEIQPDGLSLSVATVGPDGIRRFERKFFPNTEGVTLAKRDPFPVEPDVSPPQGSSTSQPTPGGTRELTAPRVATAGDDPASSASSATPRVPDETPQQAAISRAIERLAQRPGAPKLKQELLAALRADMDAKKATMDLPPTESALDEVTHPGDMLFSRRGPQLDKWISSMAEEEIIRKRGEEVLNRINKAGLYRGAFTRRGQAFEDQEGVTLVVLQDPEYDPNYPDKELWIYAGKGSHEEYEKRIVPYLQKRAEEYFGPDRLRDNDISDAELLRMGTKWEKEFLQSESLGYLYMTTDNERPAYLNMSDTTDSDYIERRNAYRGLRLHPENWNDAADAAGMERVDFDAAMLDLNLLERDFTLNQVPEQMGLGEAIYAEAATVLQAMKEPELVGDVYGAGALGARQKVFRKNIVKDPAQRERPKFTEAGIKQGIKSLSDAGGLATMDKYYYVTSHVDPDQLYSRKSQKKAITAEELRRFAARAAQTDEELAKIRARRDDIREKGDDRQSTGVIKTEVSSYSEADLRAEMRLLQDAQRPGKENRAVMATMELLDRAQQAGDLKTVEEAFEVLSKAGTQLGQMLRQFREFRGQFNKDEHFVANRMALIKQALKNEGLELNKKLESELTELIEREKRTQQKAIATLDAYLEDPTNKTKYNAARKAEFEENLAFRKMISKVRTVMPRHLRDLPHDLVTIIQGNLLSTVSTIRNFGGNYVSLLPKTLSARPLAVTMDAFYSAVTGKPRKLALPSVMEAAWFAGGSKRGYRKAISNLRWGSTEDVVLGEKHIRGFTPAQSIYAALRGFINNDESVLPVDVGTGKVRLGDRFKKLLEAIFGFSPEIMLRSLSALDEAAKDGFRAARAAEETRIRGIKRGTREFAEAQFLVDDRTRAAAEETALQYSYQNDSAVAGAFQRFEDALSAIPAGGQIARFFYRVGISPYIRTPINLLMEGMKFALPEFGLVHGLFKTAQGNRREALLSFGYAMTGAMIGAWSNWLYENEIISGGPDEGNQRKTRLTRDESGFGYFRFNLSGFLRLREGQDSRFKPGDTTIRLDTLGVTGFVMATKAEARRMYENDPQSVPDSMLTKYGQDQMAGMLAGGRFIIDQSMLQGVSSLNKAMESGQLSRLVADKVNVLTTLVVPNSVIAFRQALDSDEEKQFRPQLVDPDSPAQTIENVLIYKGFYGDIAQLPKKRGLFGDPMEATPEGQNPAVFHLVNHMKSQEVKNDIVTVVHRLYKESGNTEVIPSVVPRRLEWKGTTLNLPAKVYDSMYVAVQGAKGDAYERGLQSEGFRTAYAKYPDKAAVILANIANEAGEAAKKQWMGQNKRELDRLRLQSARFLAE